MDRPIQILKQTSGGIAFDTDILFNFLDKIGHKNVAVISITGSKSSGKTLFFKMILKFLEDNQKTEDCLFDEQNSENTSESYFIDREQTFGVWLWPQAFTFTVDNGSQVVLLLLYSRGLSLQQQCYNDSGVMFTLCCLLSSVVMINFKTNLTDAEWNFFEYFAHYALSINNESKSESFQRLLFLVRDWNHHEAYHFGLHDNTTVNNNFIKDCLIPDTKHRLETLDTRKRLLSCFNNVGSYLLPHPGKNVTKVDNYEKIDLLDKGFIKLVEKFALLIAENFEPKKIGDKTLTGYTMKQYLSKWKGPLKLDSVDSKSCLSYAEIDIITQQASEQYETNIESCLSTNPTDELLKHSHKIAEEKSLKYFSEQLSEKIRSDRFNKMLENLLETIANKYECYRIRNMNRIKDDLIETQYAQACDLYEKKMQSCVELKPSDEQLSTTQKLFEKLCIKKFSDELNDKISDDRISKMLENLRKTMANRYETYRNKNIDRINEGKVQTKYAQACDLYEKKMHSCVETNPNEDNLNNYHKIAVNECKKYFSDELSDKDLIKSFIPMLENLNKTLSNRYDTYRNKNTDRIKEEKVQTKYAQACDLYEKNIQSCVETNPNEDKLNTYHKIAEEECIKYFSDELSDKDLNERFIPMLENFRKTIANKFEYYRNKNSDRIKEEEELMPRPCLANSKSKKVKLRAKDSKMLTNLVTLELPCPGSLNGGCDRVDQYWFCGECKELLEYGFDENFYCQCGRADVYSFEFKCSSKSHSSTYLQFTESHLKGLLSNKEFNLLILGETGVGKSTWINGLVNYLTYPSFAEAKQNELLSLIASSFTITDNNYQRREITCGEDPNEVLSTGQSATQDPKSYVFDCDNKLIRIIDTPGIGDTRGIDQDKRNFDAILRYLANLDKLHGVCILLKPNNARLGVMFRFCIKELLIHLHRDASRNIVFCFTNARSTFYKPGDTFPALEKLLQENKEVDIPLNKDTIYCMDNESFRFLCALHHGIGFDEEEIDNYSKSWNKSVVETKRMLDYICGLTPHTVSNTLSINDTRKVIVSLSKPMADMTQNILTNINVVEDKKIEILNSEESEKGLKEKLYMEVIQLEATQLGYPRTVCTDQKCVTFHNIDGSSQYTTEFTTHCHPHCKLTGVKPESYPNPELRKCTAMNGTNNCTKCGCSWEKHMHITYEQKQVTKKVIDEGVEKLLKNKQTLREAKELQVQKMEEFVSDLNEEKDKITKISAKFGRFLKTNSIVPYNDALGEYLDVLIRMEKDKVSAGGDRKTLEGLEKMRQDYIEEARVLEQFMTTGGKAEQLTPIDVIRLVDQLYSLKHKGSELKQIMQVVSSSKSQMHKFQETNYRSKFKMPIDYVKGLFNWKSK